MPGSVGTSSPDRLGAGTLILASCACFLQVLAAWAYFLPWREFDGGLVQGIVPDLLDWSGSRFGLVFSALLLICFAALVSSLALGVSFLLERTRGAVAVSVSSLLNSLAIVGPLVYVQASLGFESDLADLIRAVGDLYVGWGLALVCCVGAGILLLLIHLRVQVVGPDGRALRRTVRSRAPGPSALSLAILMVAAVGAVVTVFGFFQPWYSGEASGFPDNDSAPGVHAWSYEGYEVSAIMVFGTMSAMAALIVSAVSLTMWEGHRRTSLLAAQGLAVISLALVTCWGLMCMGFELVGVDVFIRNVELGVGWYLCVMGQAILLTGTLLLGVVQPNAREPRGLALSDQVHS